MSLATVFVVAAWSVFGCGSYLKRVFWSHLAALLVGLGYLAGFIVVSTNTSNPNYWLDFWKATIYVLLLVPLNSLAAQLPFLFFRFLFGWQFTFRESAPADPFTLRDIFGFTFFCAIALGAAQLAANQWEIFGVPPDELWTHYGIYSLLSFGISLISFPALLILFWSSETGIGCGLVAAYAFAWMILTILAVAMLGASGASGEFYGVLLFLFLAYAACISIPFAVSRQKGFRLISANRYRRTIDRANQES